MTFSPTAEQKRAFYKVEKAIKNAKKLGLVFYGKQDSLVAYTEKANNYIEKEGFFECLTGRGSQIDHVSALGLINDSGADDYARYVTQADQEKYR